MKKTIAKFLARTLLKLIFPYKIRGVSNYLQYKNKPLLVVCNHQSLIDGAILYSFLNKDTVFIIDQRITNVRSFCPFLWCIDYITIDFLSSYSIKTVIGKIKQGKHCFIFPEGKVTTTGNLMYLKQGVSIIAKNTDVPILPIYIEGAQYTPFSYVTHLYKAKWRKKIKVLIEPAFKIDFSSNISHKESRKMAADSIYKKLTDMAAKINYEHKTIFEALLDSAKLAGKKRLILEDQNFAPISYKKIILGSLILGKKLYPLVKTQKYVGVLLPNVNGFAVTFFALQAYHKTVVLLNFSLTPQGLLQTVEIAQLKKVITSKAFVQAAKLEKHIKNLEKYVDIIYLDDIRESITLADKLWGLARKNKAKKLHQKIASSNDDFPAVLFFTSGSEGVPKGVLLSHKNILSNIIQFRAVLDLNQTDILFNALPAFHAFGLTVGLLAPLLCGIKCFLYPSPLHYKIVPTVCYDIGATVICGTDTFFRGYAKKAEATDFINIRYAVAGAEKLKLDTKELWFNKFGIRILEGYGATEMSPVLSVNTPICFRNGSVGKLLPLVKYKLQPVEGLTQGKKLLVKGPNRMIGYIKADKPGTVKPLDGWYDTGDIVNIDSEGYVFIVGRQKRFCKISGEMVSLTAVEEAIATCFPETNNAVVSEPSTKKGEVIVLVTTSKEIQLSKLRELFSKKEYSPLWLPSRIVCVEDMPLLASGKPNYVKVQELV